jgi:hypothetical protein
MSAAVSSLSEEGKMLALIRKITCIFSMAFNYDKKKIIRSRLTWTQVNTKFAGVDFYFHSATLVKTLSI